MGKGGGLLWDLFFGVNGGLVGTYLFDWLNISLGGIVGQLVTAVVGAVIVLWIASFFRKQVIMEVGEGRTSADRCLL